VIGFSGGARSRLRICLAASGGGHVRQLLDLERVWSAHDHFFITEDTALAHSIAGAHRTYFIPHFALGQARLGRPLRMLTGAIRSLFASARVVIRERPQVVITTGAGAVFFVVLWARLLGARVILIESFARFSNVSAFARIAGRLAHHRIVQSAGLSALWPDAAVFDPLRILDEERPSKSPLLFATVGATLPFDRLVAAVAELKANGAITETVFVQTGEGGLAPDGIETVETLPFEAMLERLRRSDIVVCHGGTGSMITALRMGCRVVVMPRQFELGEHYDNHQSEITQAFVERGLIAVANSADELSVALATVRARPALTSTTDLSAMMDHLDALLGGASGEPRGLAAEAVSG